MANNKVDVLSPLQDVNGNIVNIASLQSAMESISNYNITIIGSTFYEWQAGSFIGEGQLLTWVIDDANLTAAQNNYSTFIADYVWGSMKPHVLISVLGSTS